MFNLRFYLITLLFAISFRLGFSQESQLSPKDKAALEKAEDERSAEIYQSKEASENGSTSSNKTTSKDTYETFIKNLVKNKLLTVEYDKFKNHTKIEIDPELSKKLKFNGLKANGADLRLAGFAIVPDKFSEAQIPLVSLTFMSQTEDWRYLVRKKK